MSEDIINLLNSINVTKSDMKVTSKIKSKSVAVQFKKQLNKLMKIIDDTTPYYIRCIKPNDKNISDNFNRVRVNEQIKYSGVLSAIKVSRAGYPIRFLIKEYNKRYHLLSNELLNDLNDIDYEYGKTKIFLKNKAYDYLEDKRNEAITNRIIYIQKTIRRYLIRKKYLLLLNNLIRIQCSIRNYLSKKIYLNLKMEKSSICIQKFIRMYIDRKKYRIILFNVNNIIYWYRYRKKSIKRKCIIIIQKFFRKKQKKE